MAARERLICDSAALPEAGTGVRFELVCGERKIPAFVVRYRGEAHAYLNICPHAGTELDWNPGEFFDDERLYLLCATHGAVFHPSSGACLGGPCRGAALRKLRLAERDAAIYLLEEEER